MDLMLQFAMSAPRPLLALMIILLLPSFVALCFMNKNLRAKLRKVRRELAAALKPRPTPRKSNKKPKAVLPASHKKEANVPPRPT